MKGDKVISQISADGVKNVTFASGAATHQMTADQRLVRASGAAIAGTVYLPPIAGVPLLTYYFIQATSVATGNVTVAPFKGGQATAEVVFRECESSSLGGGTATSEVISGAYGWILLMSVGTAWLVVADDLDAT